MNKYNYEITNMEEFEKFSEEFAPKAIIVFKKPVRGIITKLLDAGVVIPGIKILHSIKNHKD